MFKKLIVLMLICFLTLAFSGCTVRTYKITKERVDQNLSAGNRGFLVGQPDALMERERKTTREIQVVELEFPKAMGAGLLAKPEQTTDMPAAESGKASVVSIPIDSSAQIKSVSPAEPAPARVIMKDYTVRKGDSLQSISQKFYGTTKRWQKIFEINREVLKRPDRIYPGQVIKIAIEEEAAGIK